MRKKTNILNQLAQFYMWCSTLCHYVLRGLRAIFYNLILIFTLEERKDRNSAIEIRIPHYFLSLLQVLIPIGLVLYFLHNAFCLFYGHVPLGKMHDEGSMLVQKVHNVLKKNNYCDNSFNKCGLLSPSALFENSCDRIDINLFTVDGRNITEPVRSEIIAEIAKNSTFTIHVSFHNESFEPCLFCIRSTPTTEVFINRRRV